MPGRSSVGALTIAVLLSWPPLSAAETALSLPRSVEVRVPGAYVRTSPSPSGSRRGTLALGARLQPLERRQAEGCAGPWYRVGPEAWICSAYLATSTDAPDAVQRPVVAEGQIVPAQYGFARADGARLYSTLEQAEAEDWEREFNPRSGLHLAKLVEYNGLHYHRLVAGGYVPAGDVIPARPSTFSGVLLEGAEVAWAKRRTKVRTGPGKGKTTRFLGKRSNVRVIERRGKGKGAWVRIGEGEWVRGAHLKGIRPATPPPDVGAAERWIDVDTTRQILTAYEGARPVFTTLVSTGRQGNATPRGTFRIWAKLATGDMSGDGDTVDTSAYLMQGVPWVMYFNEGVAIHGAYWHDDFGRRRSHGCVNVAPRDAAYLFSFASPSLPPGWSAALPTRSAQGTVVVVR